MTDATQRLGTPAPGFRLPDDIEIGRVRLQVADLGRSLEFYQEVIGFRAIAREPGRVTLGAQGSDAVLLELVEKPGVRPVPRRGLLGIYHFAVLLPDRAALGRFVRHVAALGVHVGASDHGISEATYLVDPDGITIEVYRDRARSEWPVQDGEIWAGNLPLDFPGLAREGTDLPWTGLPAGTTLGHVHFYVGDLARAEAFYHRGLGFDVMIRNLPGALFVAAGGYHHHVGLNTWAQGSPVATDDDARLVDWELVLPDGAGVAAAAESLRAGGIQVEADPAGFVARDPWGITVRVRAR
jgi:catechol 2,3-dioxygenase